MCYLFSGFLLQHLGDVVIPMINTIFTWAFITRHRVQEMEINEHEFPISDMRLYALTSCIPQHSASGPCLHMGAAPANKWPAGLHTLSMEGRRAAGLFCNHILRKHSSGEINLLFDCLAYLILIWRMDRLISGSTPVHEHHIYSLMYNIMVVHSFLWIPDKLIFILKSFNVVNCSSLSFLGATVLSSQWCSTGLMRKLGYFKGSWDLQCDFFFK